MDYYLVFKFLHVLSAIVWLGGGFCLALLGIVAASKKDDAELLRVVNSVVFLGNRLFMPASLLTVVFGVIAAYLANTFDQLWVLLGLAGFAAAFLTGTFILKPTSDRIAAKVAEGKQAEAVALGHRVLQTAKFDYTVMTVVIADMVLKPGYGDTWVLVGMAVLVIAGAVLFLGRLVRPSAVAA